MIHWGQYIVMNLPMIVNFSSAISKGKRKWGDGERSG